MQPQAQKSFNEDDVHTWRSILKEHKKKRANQVADIFILGLEQLRISDEEVPDLKKINLILKNLTGFQGVLVNGLESGKSFYTMLSNREFPIGNFIRDKKDLSYTPEPDLVHDLYGHLPFFTDQRYANFCQKIGQLAHHYFDRDDLQRQIERFFWFTIEFGLVKTSKGLRVFGAGIASSTGECDYALSGVPEVIPFDIDKIRHQEFRIDEMQKKLFLLENEQQLYDSLPEFQARLESEK